MNLYSLYMTVTQYTHTHQHTIHEYTIANHRANIITLTVECSYIVRDLYVTRITTNAVYQILKLICPLYPSVNTHIGRVGTAPKALHGLNVIM